MNEMIRVNGHDLSVKEYNGKRVVTLKEIDTVHERPCGTARKRFNDNKKHFIEGEDYFVRKTDEATKEFGITAPNGLTLITESGYYMLVKSFTDDLSWGVQRELVNNYFEKGEKAVDIKKALLDPDFLIKLATELKEEKEQRRLLEEKIDSDKPKVIFADAVSTAKTSILIGDLAKLIKQNGIDMGQKRLFEWLRENGYLIKRQGSDRNMPTQRSMELGLFEVKETAVTHSDGHTTVSKTPKVTGKGQEYFVNKFLTERSE